MPRCCWRRAHIKFFPPSRQLIHMHERSSIPNEHSFPGVVIVVFDFRPDSRAGTFTCSATASFFGHPCSFFAQPCSASSHHGRSASRRIAKYPETNKQLFQPLLSLDLIFRGHRQDHLSFPPTRASCEKWLYPSSCHRTWSLTEDLTYTP